MDDVGVLRDTVFQDIPPGAGFKTGYFSKKKMGGGYRRSTPRYDPASTYCTDWLVEELPAPTATHFEFCFWHISWIYNGCMYPPLVLVVDI